MTVEAIKVAIGELPADEKTRLAAWLLQQDLKELAAQRLALSNSAALDSDTAERPQSF